MKVRSSRSFWMVGRLAPGTSGAQAQAEIESINAQMRREHPDNYMQDNSFGGDVLSLQDLAVSGMRPALLILLGAVFLVLLIACANLTTMLLARAAAREREIAIRVALGAGRLRLLKQVFTESVLLALIGGAARSEEHTSELQSHSDLHSFPTRRSSDLASGAAHPAWRCLSRPANRVCESHHNVACARGSPRTRDSNSSGARSRSAAAAETSIH